MPVAPLLAPGGVEMRVVSQAATFTWGSWSVTWPEGFEEPNPPAADRELGWVADLGGTEVEPFGRCFVRADAQIDATLGRSNVEDVLDAARYRTSGEVFLETEIPFENLAGQLPYRDFDVNGFVPVRLGGRILENQLVTKVEESEDELGNRTATTYIGGQKFQDREALRTRNREIDRVIAQERLERGDEIGARLAASQEYEREQRQDLKRYVDRRDMEDLRDAKQDATLKANAAENRANVHAKDEDAKVQQSAAEDASAKAGAALSTARTDATNKANSAQSQAESYARQQDVLKLKEAKQYAEDEDKKLKRGVDLIIGPEGSLTRQLQSLNEDYTAKLGENGSVIADQAAHQRMLSGIVYGTPVTELEGTAFKEQQQAVNEMNDVFRNKQTTINKGFDYLFGLNEKINLAQDYTIAYHRILAESRQAHKIEDYFALYPDTARYGFVKGGRTSEPSSSEEVKDVFGSSIYADNRSFNVDLNGMRMGSGSAMAVVNIGVFPRNDQIGKVSFDSGHWFASISSSSSFLSFQMDRDLGEEIIANGGCRVIIGGGVFFTGLIKLYQERIDALNAQFRAKGLRV